MTTSQSESNHASIYMLNRFYYCLKLARNYIIVPFEFLKIIIDMKAFFASVKITCTCVQELR